MEETHLAEPPIQKGEVVCFADGKTGAITRAYPLEDKYAIKPFGAVGELRGENNSFLYFKRKELKRAVPLPLQDRGLEPTLKQAKVDYAGTCAPSLSSESDPARISMEHASTTQRLEGKVKWYNKDKGFGKILPSYLKGQAPPEEVFVHKNQIEGGPDGPHAQAIGEGSIVSYEVTVQVDGKPCACNVQVQGVLRALAAVDSISAVESKENLLRRLLNSGLQVGTFQVKGHGKATMEDRFIVRSGVMVDALGSTCKKALSAFFGVFDGHSGASCSEFVAANLDKSLFDCLRHQNKRDVSSEMAIRSALLAAFRMTEHNFFQYANKLEGGAAHSWATAGSTACTACFFGPDEEGRLRLAVANAGDSRIVLGKKDGRAVRLSEDHTPNIPLERKRIEQQGAAITQVCGIWRIVLRSGRGEGIAGLSVSRGFGDLEYKQPAGVVSAVPDVILRTIDLREDSFVILASDGIWGPISDTEAAKMVAAVLREAGEDAPRRAAQQLVEAAHQRELSDDKTALIVWFGDVPDVPQAGSSVPAHVFGSKHQARAAGGKKDAADDIFAAGRSQRTTSELAELDDLFVAYAKEMGQVPSGTEADKRKFSGIRNSRKP